MRKTTPKRGCEALEQRLLLSAAVSGLADQDIGAPAKAGSAHFAASSDTWNLTGGGSDIWGRADQFNFASQALPGDGTAIVKVGGVGNTSPWAKAGVMFRESASAGCAYADVVVTPAQGVSFQWRANANGPSRDVEIRGIHAPQWIKLVRSGNNFAAYYGSDGSHWTQIGGIQKVNLSGAALAGLAVTSHNSGRLTTAAFSNLSIEAVVSAGNVVANTISPATINAPAISPSVVPSQPAGANALWEGSAVTVSWLPVSGAVTYNVYRGTTAGGEGATPLVTGLAANGYSDKAVTVGQTYYYEISAVNPSGESVRSPEVMSVNGVDVLSYHGSSLTSQGLNSQEVQLNPGNVNTNDFGKDWASSISDTPNLDGIPTSTLNSSLSYTAPDGQAYGEPLVKTGVNITTGPSAGTVRDVVYVANELGSLYAIDADGGNVLWKDSFIYNAGGNPNPLNPAVPNGTTAIPGAFGTETNSQDVSPWICILGTPVIDPSSNSLYLIANTRFVPNGPTGDQANPHYLYTIHKIDLSSGKDTSSVFADTTLGYSNPSNPTFTYNTGPYVAGTGEGAITVNGQSRVYFNAVRQMVRPALEIYNGRVYMASASHGDNQPYHGWVFTFDESSLAINSVFNTTPNGVEGGIWSGGDGVVFDAQGNFYVETGNGSFDGNWSSTNGVISYTGLNAQGFPSRGNYGDSFVKLALDPTTTQTNENTNGWGIKVVDYFAPQNNQSLNNGDTDLGSGGPMILPASAGSAAHPSLMVGAGKEGKVYLLDTTSLGKFTYNDAGAVQEVGGAFSGALSTPAYFDGRLYYSPGYGGNPVSWALTGGQINTASKQTAPDGIAFPGSSPYISADGTQNGIMWVIDKGTGQLRAYDAANLANELWTSNQNASRDALPGGSIKFSVATPVNGRVYALSGTSLVAYGPPVPPTAPPAAPTALAAAATGASTIRLTWTDNASNEGGFSIERSTNGTTFAQVATVGVNVTSYVDSNLNPEAKYYYQVRAYNSFNTLSYSAYTNIANATTLVLGLQQPVDLYHFDEGAGTVATDSAGNNNGTLVGSPLPGWVAPGRVGSANLSFSGDGAANVTTNESAVQLTNDLSPILGSTSSLDVWVKTTQTGNNTHWLAPAVTGVEQSGAGNDINWGTLNASGQIGLYVGDSGGVYSTNPVNDGQWHNIAMTRDATTGIANIYVDGALNATGTFDTGNKTSVFSRLGALSDVANDSVTSTGATFFNGQLDEVRIYDQVLDPVEVQALSVAPAAPTNLTVVAASGTELDLSWTDNSAFADGYILQRSANGGPWVSLPELPSGTTSYNDTALSPNTAYSYRVQAVDTAGPSAFSNVATLTTPTTPTTPKNATATFNSTTEIDLQWTDTATNATGYRLLRGLIGGEFVVIDNNLPPTANSYKDTGLTPGTEYDYHIQAFNVAGYSDFAGIHTGTIAVPPANPQVTIGAGQVSLSWTAPAYDGDAQNLTYDIYRGTTPGGESATPLATAVTTPNFTDSAVANGQTYYYEITAVDLGGESAKSAEVAAALQSATIAAISVSTPASGPIALQTAADGLRLLPAGRATDVPLGGISRINITLSAAAVLSPADVTVTGTTIANYGPVTISGSGTSYVLTLAQPITKADRVTVTIGNAGITTFTRRLDVLPGDANDDGKVTFTDFVSLSNNFGKPASANPFADFNGDGTIGFADFVILSNDFGALLPGV
ncbi:MAG TPA: fibronectin type III domain-containing protein [Tepidisphaeraceae bacterium]|nr:fibronectin type III domain-containing protein [Tepidisphaeraceae bacterium]